MKNIKFIIIIAILTCMGLTSCDDFLNRPDKNNYMLANFYKNDDQCLQATNVLYSVPWFDFFGGWQRIGDCQSGNYYSGGNSFWLLTTTADDGDMAGVSASLWSVNARANTLLENIDAYAGEGTTEAGRNKAKGEALVWKALAYFFMVRIYGPVPIMHNNTELLGAGTYNQLYRAKVENVYDYIIMTLEQAVEWLPERSEKGRIDKYCAYGLLAKVHLTRSGYGRSGDRNQADLDKAKEYARKVIYGSERTLTPEYADIFRGSHNADPESMIAWRWTAAADNYYTASNELQQYVTPTGFWEQQSWGGWTGPSIDLQEAFGEKYNGPQSSPSGAMSPSRNNTDKRRKATVMLYGDVYENFWRDHPGRKGVDGSMISFPNGYDMAKYYLQVLGSWHPSTGSNSVKNIVGDNADHYAEFGSIPFNRGTSLATHILRLADVYLIYAEAVLGNAASTSDAEALRAFNEVRKRAGVPEKSVLTFEDIFKERRLELAFEGDFWYDIVRWHYYKPEEALAYLNSQNRKNYAGLEGYYKDRGWENWGQPGAYPRLDEKTGLYTPRVNDDEPDGKPFTHNKFSLPFPSTDMQMNPHLKEDPVDHDISQYHYK